MCIRDRPKTDGGFRPIGLLPHLPRIWMRARRDEAKQWEIRCNRDFLYAGSGRGSTVAAWKQAARGELAAAAGKKYAQVLLDLVKAFERIPYRVLRREADNLGYPLRLLKLAIATYKLPRVIRVGNAVSDLVWAVRGIVAGSGLATTEMRLVMIDIVDKALIVHPHVTPTLFVDDLSNERSGDRPTIAHELGGFTNIVIARIKADGMEVSTTKSLISASTPTLGEEVKAKLTDSSIPYALRVKSLGVGLAAGVARNTRVMNTRLKQFRKRLPRFRGLRRAGIDTATIVRTGGVAALMHGYGGMGVSPTMLLHQRRAVTAATAPKSGLGGQQMEVALMIADGSKRGKADPAFPAHIDVVQHWAQAIWNRWLPEPILAASLNLSLIHI